MDKFSETISSISESSSTAFISKTINSPATIELIDKVKQKFPKASWASFDLDSKENQITALKK